MVRALIKKATEYYIDYQKALDKIEIMTVEIALNNNTDILIIKTR